MEREPDDGAAGEGEFPGQIGKGEVNFADITNITSNDFIRFIYLDPSGP